MYPPPSRLETVTALFFHASALAAALVGLVVVL